MALLTALPACKSNSADRATANPTVTVATEPAPTTTTNPYAVPAVIDVAYVNRVLAALDAVNGDVVRLVVNSKTIPRDAYDRLRAIYNTDEWLQLQIDSFQADLRTGLVGYKSPPGNASSQVTQLLTLKPSCIFVQVDRDYSRVGQNSASSDTQWIALRPLDPLRDPHGYNITPWAMAYEGFTQARKQPPDPCVG